MARLSRLIDWIPDPIPTLPARSTRGQSGPAWEQKQTARPDDKPRPANSLGIRLGEHWAIVGMTGSGKSHFAKSLMEYLRRRYPTAKRYILDSTEDGMDGIVGRMDVRGNRVPDLLRDSTWTQIWTPDTDVPDLYNQWFEKLLYKREPAIILVDELASLTQGKSGEPPDGFIKLLKQGRKHGITVIALTQSVSRVTTTLFGQMTHFTQFRIQPIPYDISQVRMYLDIAKEQQRPPTNAYGFFYRRTDGMFAHREFASMQAFFRNTI